ncbi:MAG: hypothetical protein ACQEWS_13595 [Bacillota bacterium]
MTQTFHETIKILRLHLFAGMNATVKSYKLLKESSHNDQKLASALAHFNYAQTQITAAHTIYQLKTPGENAEIESFFCKFHEFNSEFMNSIESSNLWTLLKLENLISAYNQLPSGLELSTISLS